MITIDQLLESVDLDFEPRWVTKSDDGDVYIFEYIPEAVESTGQWISTIPDGYATFGYARFGYARFGKIKLSEFDGKDWTECIYEVPRKTTGKIKKLERHIKMGNDGVKSSWPPSGEEFMCKINQLVDAVNELKGAKNE